MKTKENRQGKSFDVTFNKPFFTKYGLKFILKEYDKVPKSDFNEFYMTDLKLHMFNVGCVIFIMDEIDNDYYICDANSEDCFEIYNMIEKNLCV